MKSWKTTALGIATGISMIATQAIALLDDDPGTEFSVGILIAALTSMGIGWFARDNDKSSESVGAA